MSFVDGQLIELVQAHPCLYDKKDSQFKNKLFVENVWDKIGTILNTPADLCIQRWTNLRHRYFKEKRTIKGTPSRSRATSKIWEYTDLMSFLDTFIVQRTTSGNIQKCTRFLNEGGSSCTSESDTFSSQPSTSSGRSIITEEAAISSFPDEATVELTLEELSSSSSSRPTNAFGRLVETPLSTRKRKKSSSTPDDLAKSFKSSCEAITQHLQHQNEDFIFGQSIGATLARIKNPLKKIEIKTKIWNILAENVKEGDFQE